MARQRVGGGRPSTRWSAWLLGATLVLLATVLNAHAVHSAEPELPPLAANPGSPRLPGKFIWADLATDDIESAKRFYGPLFGWEFQPAGGAADGYTIAWKDGRPLAGLVRARARADTKGAPRWVGYISVADVPKAGLAIVSAGGRQLVPPKLLPQRGEQAVFADPEGVVFGVMRSAAGDPEDYLAEPGEWIWIQLLSHDARKATAFYRSVASYEVIENTQSPRTDDFVLVIGDVARAVVAQIPPDRPKVKPAWLAFVRVDDLAASLGRARELGGKVLVAPRSDLFEGRVAVVADPGGAAAGLLQWDVERDAERKQRP